MIRKESGTKHKYLRIVAFIGLPALHDGQLLIFSALEFAQLLPHAMSNLVKFPCETCVSHYAFNLSRSAYLLLSQASSP